MEFSSENEDAKRVPGSLENEYTISVTAPGKYLWNYVSFLSVYDVISETSCLWCGFYLLQTCLLGLLHSPCTLTCLVSTWDLSHSTPVWKKSIGTWKRPWTPWPSSARWDIEDKIFIDPAVGKINCYYIMVRQDYTDALLIFKAETFCPPVRLLIWRQTWRNPWTIC